MTYIAPEFGDCCRRQAAITCSARSSSFSKSGCCSIIFASCVTPRRVQLRTFAAIAARPVNLARAPPFQRRVLPPHPWPSSSIASGGAAAARRGRPTSRQAVAASKPLGISPHPASHLPPHDPLAVVGRGYPCSSFNFAPPTVTRPARSPASVPVLIAHSPPRSVLKGTCQRWLRRQPLAALASPYPSVSQRNQSLASSRHPITERPLVPSGQHQFRPLNPVAVRDHAMSEQVAGNDPRLPFSLISSVHCAYSIVVPKRPPITSRGQGATPCPRRTSAYSVASCVSRRLPRR